MSLPERYSFGAFTLDVAERRLLRGTEAVHLGPKTFDVLVVLVRQAGRLVTKRDLLERVWPDAFVEEGILAVHVSALRKALGGSNSDDASIETVPRAGYRFVTPIPMAAVTEGLVAADARPLEAYQLVGRGRMHLLSASFFEVPQAVAAFRAAIDLDPTYAEAHAGLALARCAQAGLRACPLPEAYAEAKASALRALAMDAGSADAQTALGQVLFLSEWDWRGAERSFSRALAISPGQTEALLHYGSLLEALGRLDAGLRLKRQALARDPESANVFVVMATSYWNQRRYDEMAGWLRRALNRDPRHLLARELLVGVYWQQDEIESFLAENIRQAEAFGCAEEQMAAVREGCAALRRAFAAGGRAEVARAMLAQMPGVCEGPLAVRRAVLHGEAGELDEAFEYLDRAQAARDPGLVHLAVAPQWDPLRGDPRFAERLTRMGLPATAMQPFERRAEAARPSG